MDQPKRVINSCAPIRICDVGGWTDAWFAECGACGWKLNGAGGDGGIIPVYLSEHGLHVWG